MQINANAGSSDANCHLAISMPAVKFAHTAIVIYAAIISSILIEQRLFWSFRFLYLNIVISEISADSASRMKYAYPPGMAADSSDGRSTGSTLLSSLTMSNTGMNVAKPRAMAAINRYTDCQRCSTMIFLFCVAKLIHPRLFANYFSIREV